MNSLGKKERIVAIDILRGMVMVVMALDHARDYLCNYHANPLDIEHATSAMFFTRWITHFCAPIFIFLSGTSAFLSLQKTANKNQAAGLLLKRGLWLIVLEFTIIRLGWQFNLDYHFAVCQVIWAIGCSMVCLAALIYLPWTAILIFGAVLVLGHNSLDAIHADSFGNKAIFWNLLHEQNFVHYGNGYSLFIIYPLIPWIGVMALGYCFGRVFLLDKVTRNDALLYIGLGAICLFIALRYSNLYGDHYHWHAHKSLINTIKEFVKCEKYPPSLLYLLMTIGPAILIMPALEEMKNSMGNFFSTYGKVPMFYYILHIYLIHGIALISGLIVGEPISTFVKNGALFDPNLKWGFSLAITYWYWIGAVLLLYYPCKWFAGIKARYNKWWLRYL